MAIQNIPVHFVLLHQNSPIYITQPAQASLHISSHFTPHLPLPQATSLFTLLMAPRGLITLALALAFVATLWCGARAQTTGCTTTLINLAPCLTYITGNSSTPSSTCCTSLAGVVQTSPQCLCSVINGTAASNLGVAINQTAALQLPTACNVQTPPLSQCNGWLPFEVTLNIYLFKYHDSDFSQFNH